MARISKVQTKAHDKACELVDNNQDLTLDDRIFILNNWNPMASHNVGKTATFFTPLALAKELQIETLNTTDKRVLDLCAGIGALAFWALQWHYSNENLKIVCIEHNPEFVRVGKRVLPEALWLCKDAFDPQTYEGLGQFDEVISNPPYGLSLGNGWLNKLPSQFQAAEIAMKVSDTATFLLAQGDCPFEFSGKQMFSYTTSNSYERFHKKTGIYFHPNCGIDTSFALKDWQGVKPTVEIVNISKSNY